MGVIDRIVPINKGEWSEGTYDKLNIVRHNGKVWQSKVELNREEPTDNSEKWMFLVRDGIDALGATWDLLAGKPFETLDSDDFKVENGKLSVNGTLEGVEQIANKVTSLSSSSTDTQYPSAKAVYDVIGDVVTLLDAL